MAFAEKSLVHLTLDSSRIPLFQGHKSSLGHLRALIDR